MGQSEAEGGTNEPGGKNLDPGGRWAGKVGIHKLEGQAVEVEEQERVVQFVSNSFLIVLVIASYQHFKVVAFGKNRKCNCVD